MIKEECKLGIDLNQTRAVCKRSSIDVVLPETLLEFAHLQSGRPVVVFRSEQTGEGNPVLGDQLTIELLQALLSHPEPPAAVLFYNSAIHLTLEESQVLDPLRKLSDRGCDLLICKTSLQMLAPDCEPVVGRTADMIELVDRMRQANKLLWP